MGGPSEEKLRSQTHTHDVVYMRMRHIQQQMYPWGHFRLGGYVNILRLIAMSFIYLGLDKLWIFRLEIIIFIDILPSLLHRTHMVATINTIQDLPLGHHPPMLMVVVGTVRAIGPGSRGEEGHQWMNGGTLVNMMVVCTIVMGQIWGILLREGKITHHQWTEQYCLLLMRGRPCHYEVCM